MLMIPGLSAGGAESGKLSEKQGRELLNQGAVVIDVRTPEEYAAEHAVGSTNIPVDQISKRIGEVVPNKSTAVLVHCQSGRRSASALKTLRASGYTNAWDLSSLKNAQKLTKKKP